MFGIAEQNGLIVFWEPNQIREEHWVVFYVIATQVENPGDLVKSGHELHIDTWQTFAHFGVLGEGVHASEFCREDFHWLAGTGWFFSTPDQINQVLSGFDNQTFLNHRFASQIVALCRVLREIKTDYLALFSLFHCPGVPE